jgi:hypothetical protein
MATTSTKNLYQHSEIVFLRVVSYLGLHLAMKLLNSRLGLSLQMIGNVPLQFLRSQQVPLIRGEKTVSERRAVLRLVLVLQRERKGVVLRVLPRTCALVHACAH